MTDHQLGNAPDACPTCHQAEHKLSCPLREGGQLRLPANLPGFPDSSLAQALKAADQGEAEGLLGMYPMAAQVLAAELRRLHAEVERMSADAQMLDWLLHKVSGKEFRRLGVFYGDGATRAAIDQAMKDAP